MESHSMIERYEHKRDVVRDDIDHMGHVNNLSFLRWALDAAQEHSHENGWNFERYKELGAGWVVRSHQIKYLRPAFEGEPIIVRTWISQLGRATCRRRYEIERVTDAQRLADAHTDWAFVDFERMVPRRIPPEVTGAFLVIADDSADA